MNFKLNQLTAARLKVKKNKKTKKFQKNKPVNLKPRRRRRRKFFSELKLTKANKQEEVLAGSDYY